MTEIPDIKTYEELSDIPDWICAVKAQIVNKCDNEALRKTVMFVFEMGYAAGRNEPKEEIK